MRVKMLKSEPVRLSKRETKVYQVDWAGEVDDTLARKWIAEGSAVALVDDTSKPVELTNEEKAVLKAAAQQALAGVIAQAGGETVDPETGEVLPAQSVAEIVASLTDDEIADLATAKGVKVAKNAKRPAIEKALVKKIEAEQAAAAG